MTSIGLYLDRELQHPVPREFISGKLVWMLDFGKTDVGEEKTRVIYVENQSVYAIEDLKIRPVTRSGDDMKFNVSGDMRDRMEKNETHRFTVSIGTPLEAKLGRRTVGLEITGYFTE